MELEISDCSDQIGLNTKLSHHIPWVWYNNNNIGLHVAIKLSVRRTLHQHSSSLCLLYSNNEMISNTLYVYKTSVWVYCGLCWVENVGRSLLLTDVRLRGSSCHDSIHLSNESCDENSFQRDSSYDYYDHNNPSTSIATAVVAVIFYCYCTIENIV